MDGSDDESFNHNNKTLNFLKDLIKIDKKPRRGLIPLEWVVLGYLVLTLLIVLFTYTKLPNPDSMIWGRVRVVAIMAGMWAVYRIAPCQLTMLLRVACQGALLVWWYPDTFEINRILPNLDHLFAQADQVIFGFQPALAFPAYFTSDIVSELMYMGYACYYPLILVTILCFVLFRDNWQRCAFVLLGSFFCYYLIFDLLPVAGPTFYYKAIGMDNVVKGIFPAVGDYFNTHQDCLAAPGYSQGLFYHLVEDAREVGERPTAAFPSSHVGVSTVCMLLLWQLRSHKPFWITMPIYVFLCLATVYIQAHYAVDAIAGLVSGVLFYAVLMAVSRKIDNFAPLKRKRR